MLECWKLEDLRHWIQDKKAAKTASNQKVTSGLFPLFRFHVHEDRLMQKGELKGDFKSII
jgi:hypothetical protein